MQSEVSVKKPYCLPGAIVTPAVSSDSSAIGWRRTDSACSSARGWTGGGCTTTALPPVSSPRQAALPQVAGERLALVDRGVRVADDRRQRVGDVARGVALPAEVPGHADLVDAAAGDLEGPQPLGDERARLDLAPRSGEHDPVEVLNALLGG